MRIVPHVAGLTCPIYRAVGSSGLTHHGTVLILRCGNICWLVTALHVLRNGGHHLWLPGKPFQYLEHSLIFHYNTALDVAYMKLPAAVAAAVEASIGQIVPIEMLDRSIAPHGDQCVVLGYPDQCVEPDGENLVMNSAQMVYDTDLLTANVLKHCRLDPAYHLAARAENVSEGTDTIKNFDFHGLSGGAFCSCNGKTIQRIIGIITDYDPKRRILIGSQIGSVVLGLARELMAARPEIVSLG
jgi:hypothetical protein